MRVGSQGLCAQRNRVLMRHPQLRDYREPLLNLMRDRVDLRLTVSKASDPRELDAQFGTTIENSREFLIRVLRGSYETLLTSQVASREGLIAGAIARLRGKPWVVWEEGWHYPRSGVRARLRILQKMLGSSLGSGFFASGERAAARQREFLRGRSKPIVYAPQCALDYNRFARREESEARFWVECEGPRFLFMGRLIKLKGVDVLLSSFGEYLQSGLSGQLLVVGSGPEERTLKRMASAIGPKRCRFKNWVPSAEEKAALYATADYVVVPSVTLGCLYEAWGLVVNEAMSCRTPVILSDHVGCAAEFGIDPDACIVFRGGSKSDLTRAMRHAAVRLGDAEYMSRAARQRFEVVNNYKKMADGLLAILEQCRSAK